MSKLVDELLYNMLRYAVQTAPRIPTPAEPPDEAAEQGADEHCRQVAAGNAEELPSPEVCVALIPRLRAARAFAPMVEAQFSEQAALGDLSANTNKVFEWLLVKLWHEAFKEAWLSGKIPQPS